MIPRKRSKLQGPQLTEIEKIRDVFQALIVAVIAPTILQHCWVIISVRQ